MNEIVPVVGGLVVGSLLPLVPARLRILVAVVAASCVGALATVVSGEYRLGWEYLLFDVPLAALGTVAGYLAADRLLLPARAGREPGGAPRD